MNKKRVPTRLIGTIERFPTYALNCLMTGECEGLEYKEAKAVEDLRESFLKAHDFISYDQDAASIKFTNDPEFGLPCEAMVVNVWGRARDNVIPISKGG